jgi:hypothetical protein
MKTGMKEYLNLVMIHLSLTPYEGLVFNKEAEFIGISFRIIVLPLGIMCSI